jgi:hypothetical protein
MATVFQETTQLAAITDQKPVRLVIPKFRNGKLLITKIAGEVRPNYQIMYSLGADAFITAFNQRLSTWTIHGLHIPGGCDGQNFKGEPAFVDLYRKFNIRTAKQPLDMAFNDIVLVGFFIGMTIQDYSQNGVDGFAWETPFLGRINNLLEDPDPIVVADGAAGGDADPNAVRNGMLGDGTYFGENPGTMEAFWSKKITEEEYKSSLSRDELVDYDMKHGPYVGASNLDPEVLPFVGASTGYGLDAFFSERQDLRDLRTAQGWTEESIEREYAANLANLRKSELMLRSSAMFRYGQ